MNALENFNRLLSDFLVVTIALALSQPKCSHCQQFLSLAGSGAGGEWPAKLDGAFIRELEGEQVIQAK